MQSADVSEKNNLCENSVQLCVITCGIIVDCFVCVCVCFGGWWWLISKLKSLSLWLSFSDQYKAQSLAATVTVGSSENSLPS